MLLSLTTISVILVDLLFLPVKEFMSDQIFLKSFRFACTVAYLFVIEINFAFAHLFIYSVP
jgi:hypothetical protein